MDQLPGDKAGQPVPPQLNLIRFVRPSDASGGKRCFSPHP
jgi:hypothetical protein